MDTLAVQDYLQMDRDNLCFKIENQYYFTTKLNLARQLNDARNIKYGCIKVGDGIEFTDDANIIYDQEYLSLSSLFGMQFIIEREEIESIVSHPVFVSQVYVAIPRRTLPGVISLAYINGVDGSSSDHCTPEKEMLVYTLRPGVVKCKSSATSEDVMEEEAVVPINPNIVLKLQYKGRILQFEIENQTITLGEIKQLLLDRLLAEQAISSPNQNVKFIYKAKIYTDNDITLRTIEPESNEITLQCMVSPIAGGKKTRKSHRGKTRKTRKSHRGKSRKLK
jgi:hypothetical protein